MPLRIKHFIALFIATLFLTGFAQSNEQDQGIDSIKNLLHPGDTVYTGGQPSPEQFTALATAGVKHVISFRPTDETPDLDEQALVTSAGMQFHNIAIADASALSRENVEALDAVLKAIGDDTVFLHCASGNRVGAMMALRANWLYSTPADKALELGKNHGLTRMEAAVVPLLER